MCWGGGGAGRMALSRGQRRCCASDFIRKVTLAESRGPATKASAFGPVRVRRLISPSSAVLQLFRRSGSILDE